LIGYATLTNSFMTRTDAWQRIAHENQTLHHNCSNFNVMTSALLLAGNLEASGFGLLSVLKEAFERLQNVVNVLLAQVGAVSDAEFNLIDVYGARRADDKVRIFEPFDPIVEVMI